MPELPELTALAAAVQRHGAGGRLATLEIGSMTALKTVRPAVSDLMGEQIVEVRRRGKYLIVQLSEHVLVTHLYRAGWITLGHKRPPKPLPLGRGSIVARALIELPAADDDAANPSASQPATPGADEPSVHTIAFTEAGTNRRLALWLGSSEDAVPAMVGLGPDALDLAADAAAWAKRLRGSGQQIKTWLRDQRQLAGVGNAYSDEILHAARLSPFARCAQLSGEQGEELRLVTQRLLTQACTALVGLPAASIKAANKARFAVHGREGQPCPVCGTTVRSVHFADSSLDYCPGCQTGQKVLADRRMSRLLK